MSYVCTELRSFVCVNQHIMSLQNFPLLEAKIRISLNTARFKLTKLFK